MNKHQWWQLVEDNWGALEELIFVTGLGLDHAKMPITAPMAEVARRQILLECPPKKYDYELLKQNRDPKMAKFFEDLYWQIPESTDCWKYRGFGVLCELCEERECLGEDL